MKRLLLAMIVGLTLSTLPACANKKLTPETPKAAAALQSDAIVIRVNELQASVIQACGAGPECAPNTLSTSLARTIVQTCINLRTTLKAVPDGWQATVRTAWAEAKPRFAGLTNPIILTAIAAVDAILGGL